MKSFSLPTLTRLCMACFLAGSALLATQARAQSLSAVEIASIDSLFNPFDGPETPGAALAVVRDGKIAYSRGYGSANLEYGIPITPDKTVFHVASVSKQFTVYAVMLLQQEGKLSLDDPIRKYIPEVPDFGKPITLRHLATHTSGLRDQWSLLVMAGWRSDDVITRDHILKMVSRQKELNFDPGEEYTYCNTGFTLLAEAVARVSGQSFAEFTRERIFVPLQMERTLFYDDHEKIVPNRAYSYYHQDGTLKKDVLNFANVGATSLFTTAEDLARWAIHLNNPPSEVQDMVEQMNTLAVLNNGETFGGAYGQFRGPYRGLDQIQHGGADAGYRSYLGRFPDQDFAVAVVSNYADSGPQGLAMQVVDILLKDEIEDQPETFIPTEEPAITLTPEQMRKFEGYYWFEDRQTYRRIYLKDGELIYARAGGAENRLAPISANRFKMLDIGAYAVVEFSYSEDGKALEFIDFVGENTRMEAYDFVPPTPEYLRQYTGTYYSEELDTSLEFIFEGEELVARHNRHPDEKITYLREDRVTVGPANTEFVRGEDGSITGMKMNTGRVRDLFWVKK